MRRSGAEDPEGWAPVYRVVRRIPVGRVATYGQIAVLAGMPRAARQVGYALHALADDSTVPWHRVVNATGRISLRDAWEVGDLQRARLESEGVGFDAGGRIDLAAAAWRPRVRPSRGEGGRQRTSQRGAGRKGRVGNRGSST